jgi:Cft2 family RNA processing exonuclease
MSPLPRLTAISGLGGKSPACFLVETGARRFLLDLGEGPDPGMRPNLDDVGRVDAVLITHSHRDHAGALDLLPQIGDPPVYASTIVAARLQHPDLRPLPLAGSTDLLGVPVVTGRSGHAPGGIWMHFAIGHGLLYMGDHSTESAIYAFDPPPPAGTIILDASYGDADVALDEQAAALEKALDKADALLPVPADGRGPEIALHLARCGLDLRLDDSLRASLERLAIQEQACLRDGVADALASLARAAGTIDGPQGVMLATPADASQGEAARLLAQWQDELEPTILFTGYLPAVTPAGRLLARGRAKSLRWNVHPRLSDNMALVRSIGAERVIPAFCAPRYDDALARAFAPAKVTFDLPIAF